MRLFNVFAIGLGGRELPAKVESESNPAVRLICKLHESIESHSMSS